MIAPRDHFKEGQESHKTLTEIIAELKKGAVDQDTLRRYLEFVVDRMPLDFYQKVGEYFARDGLTRPNYEQKTG